MATSNARPDTPLALDTDVFTDWRNQRPHTLRAIQDYQDRLPDPPKLTAMTVFEARLGFEMKLVKTGALDERTERDRLKAEQLIQTCGVLEIGEAATTIAAHVFARLSQSQRNKHWRDIFIAATALAHHHGVATKNQSDFELIGQHLPPGTPDLSLAIWKP